MQGYKEAVGSEAGCAQLAMEGQVWMMPWAEAHGRYSFRV